MKRIYVSKSQHTYPEPAVVRRVVRGEKESCMYLVNTSFAVDNQTSFSRVRNLSGCDKVYFISFRCKVKVKLNFVYSNFSVHM